VHEGGRCGGGGGVNLVIFLFKLFICDENISHLSIFLMIVSIENSEFEPADNQDLKNKRSIE
jgi:hypothetical protein